MHRRFSISLISCLLLIAGALVWWWMSGDAAPGSVPFDNDGVEEGESVTSADVSTGPQLQEERRDDAPQGDAVQHRYDDSGYDTITLCGRVAFSDEFKVDLCSAFDLGGECVRITWWRDGVPPAEVGSDYIQIKPDLTFHDECKLPSYGLKPGATDAEIREHFRQGRWQAFVQWDAPEPMAIQWVKPGAPVIGEVEPEIADGRVDFGVVTIERGANFGKAKLLRGRLVHSSGTPVSNSGPYAIIARAENGEILWEHEVHTDEQGRFHTLRWFDLSDETVDSWWIAHCDGRWHLNDPAGFARIEPEVDDFIYDFDEVEVEGALLDISLFVEPDDIDKPVSLWVGHNLCQPLLDLPQGESVSQIWMPSGRMFCKAELHVEGRLFTKPTCWVTPRDGEVVPIQLTVAEYKTLPVRIEKPRGGPDKHIEVKWSYEIDGEVIAGDGRTGIEPAVVPIVEGAITRVTVTADDYIETEAIAEPGMEEVVVELLPVDELKAKLKVVLPNLREDLNPRGLSPWVTVESLDTDWRRTRRLSLFRGAAKAVTFSVPAGRFRIEYEGGAGYGYSDNRLTDDVEVAVAPGEYAEVQLPPYRPPPWEHYAEAIEMEVRIGGRPGKVWARFHDGNPEQSEWTNIHHGMRRSSPPPSFMQGEHGPIPLEVALPKEDGDDCIMKLKISPRLDVRAYQNGKPVKDFEAWALRVKRNPNWVRSIAGSEDGSALLWAWSGEVLVRVFTEDGYLGEKVITLAETGLQTVQIDSDRVSLTVQMDDESEMFWNLWRMMEDGSLHDYGYLNESRTRILPRGIYRLVPAWGYAEERRTIDLTDGKDRTLKLPALKHPDTGCCLIPYDVSKFGDADVDVDYAWCPADVIPGQAMDPYHHENMASDDKGRIVAEGILLPEVPLDTRFILTITLRIQKPGQYREEVLVPMLATVEESGQVLPGEWKPGSRPSEEWKSPHFVYVDLIEGYALRMYAVPPGRHAVRFYDEGECILEYTLDVRPGTRITMPQDLREKLIELGQIKPK